MTVPPYEPNDSAPAPAALTPVPVPEPDSYRLDIPTQPRAGETGAECFVREIAMELSYRLPPPVTAMLYRENPWDRRPCPQASFYDITISGHQIHIAAYQARHPRDHLTHSRYAITLDGHPVPFERAPIDPLPRQMAYAIWSAHLDQPDHRHPITPPETTNAGDTDKAGAR